MPQLRLEASEQRSLRLSEADHTLQPWRIHQLTRDFKLEDVWALPTPGDRDDFARLVAAIASGDLSRGSSWTARALFAIRWRAGELLGWDAADQGIGTRVPSLLGRLPVDLLGAESAPALRGSRFSSLYLLADEWAAEVANRTIHGVLHLGWVADGSGRYRGQMAVLVKTNGFFGTAYMKAIRPFRRRIVYPAMIRQIERAWLSRAE